MPDEPDTRIEDRGEIGFRVETIGIGLRLTLITCAAATLYALATWDEQPNRTLIVTVLAGVSVLSALLALLPRERIVLGRWREPFFFAWSLATILLIAVIVAAEPTPTTPLALLFFLPIIFAALSYPLPSVVALAAIDFLSYVAAASIAIRDGGITLADAPDQSYTGFFAFCLALVAMMCAGYARREEERRTELARISRADPLTGSLNRRGFEERFAAELNAAGRDGRPLTLLQLDLDDFKRINDTRGHAAGDELLVWVVRTLEDLLRPTDTVGRLGGDEFAVLLPGAAVGNAREVVGRISAALAERAPASVGLASFPIDGTSLEELHRAADGQLYEHKTRRPPTRVQEAVKELSWGTTLASAVDRRMAVQHQHSVNVGDLAAAIAERLGWTEPDVGLLRVAGILHDVGKVAVPDRILRKAGPLTAEEFEQIKPFPVAGAEMVSRIEGLEAIVPWIRHSHERMDGGGYPDGLAGEATPLGARILHVADAFDSMTSDRTYRDAMPRERAVAELVANAGTQFDTDCVAALQAHLSEVEAR